MRILTRYILGEILSHTLIGCALFTFILFMQELPHILEMVVRNSSTFTSVMEIVLFTLPNFFMITIPMAVLVGVLLGLSRLAADSEIIAMRASGLGIGYFVRVASIVAVAGTLLGLVNSLYVAPRANQAILEMDRRWKPRRPPTRFSRASSMRISTTSSSTCRTCAPEPARPTGARSSWPTSPIPPRR